MWYLASSPRTRTLRAEAMTRASSKGMTLVTRCMERVERHSWTSTRQVTNRDLSVECRALPRSSVHRGDTVSEVRLHKASRIDHHAAADRRHGERIEGG